MDRGDSGCGEEMFSCKESDILFPTKCFEVGLTGKSSSSLSSLLCQPSPIARPDRISLYPCVATVALV